MRRVLPELITACAVIGIVGTTRASADHSTSVAAAIGAGGQGEASYGALELRLDSEWRGVRLGLGARGVWIDGAFRRRDWARRSDAIRVLRYFEAAGHGVAIAAGNLAPSQLAQLVNGYRATLDDRARVGARGSLTADRLSTVLEIDDVLDPALIGGALAVRLGPAWSIRSAMVVDPGQSGHGSHALSALELGVGRQWRRAHQRVELGGAIVGEPSLGISAVTYAVVELERGKARWSVTADGRAGTGTVGGAFGPLYRVERTGLFERARRGDLAGLGGGLSLERTSPAGGLAIGVRARPGLGTLVSLGGSAAASRWLQAGGWFAAAAHEGAGAAELRIAWGASNRGAGAASSASARPDLFTVLQLERLYSFDAMQPVAAWSATAWFGIASD